MEDKKGFSDLTIKQLIILVSICSVVLFINCGVIGISGQHIEGVVGILSFTIMLFSVFVIIMDCFLIFEGVSQLFIKMFLKK